MHSIPETPMPGLHSSRTMGCKCPPTNQRTRGVPGSIRGHKVSSASSQVRFALAVEEIRVLGEWALERGTYSISLNAKAGGPAMKDVGKYITVYQRKPAHGW